jgi:hypothetical protein
MNYSDAGVGDGG